MSDVDIDTIEMIKYCKKIYLLYGREVSSVYFWGHDNNPHYEEYNTEKNFYSEDFDIIMIDNRYDTIDGKSNYLKNQNQTVEFTDKFIDVAMNAPE